MSELAIFKKRAQQQIKRKQHQQDKAEIKERLKQIAKLQINNEEQLHKEFFYLFELLDKDAKSSAIELEKEGYKILKSMEKYDLACLESDFNKILSFHDEDIFQQLTEQRI